MTKKMKMNEIWKNLPDDICDKILSYGDPDIRKKFVNVMSQISYYNSEFKYQRKNTCCRWYNIPEEDYYKYALREVYLKKNVNKYYGELSSRYFGNSQMSYTSFIDPIIDFPSETMIVLN